MALISKNNIKRMDKERNSIHKEVESTFTSFSDKSGCKYFQIDTYGSNDRQLHGKISQSIQFDKDTAVELIRILKHEFGV